MLVERLGRLHQVHEIAKCPVNSLSWRTLAGKRGVKVLPACSMPGCLQGCEAAATSAGDVIDMEPQRNARKHYRDKPSPQSTCRCAMMRCCMRLLGNGCQCLRYATVNAGWLPLHMHGSFTVVACNPTPGPAPAFPSCMGEILGPEAYSPVFRTHRGSWN